MSIANVLAEFESNEVILNRDIFARYSFNDQGTSLYYYIYGEGSQVYDAGLKLDFFPGKVRFTNFKKPHPVEKYKPYFDKFIAGYSCSYDDIEQSFASSSSTTIEMLNMMAQH
ncbi:hypothetical protein [Nostoc sp.]|uniref:hypothetical protein n=1 Tax=Nostoc sp. TaxID=1180 RepID=UPI002FF6BDCB